MVEKAYTDACYLQEELLYIAQEFKVEELNLLDRANKLEKIIQGILADHNVKINSYSSVEDFLAKCG